VPTLAFNPRPQHVSILIDVLVGVAELDAVRYVNEQCVAPPGLNGGCATWNDIVVEWRALFDVGEADTAASAPTQQVSWA
jgi:hypothetical protein